MSISVIVPAYNAAGTLATTLASVAAQMLPPDEVVVIDDGSTDDTTAIASGWSDRLPLTVISPGVNQGLGAARKIAIERSSGDLIALLDADDVWFPDHLQVLRDTYRRHGGGLIGAAAYRWWPNERVDHDPSTHINPIPPPAEQPAEILRRNFLYSCVLFSRADYAAVGGFSRRRVDEDWELWIRMIRNGMVVTAPETVTVLYRQRSDSLSALDGCLDADIELLSSFDDLDAVESRIVSASLRRRQARRVLLEGLALADAGDLSAARRRWARAALMDLSPRRGRDSPGNQSIRALACLVAPSWAASRALSSPRSSARQ